MQVLFVDDEQKILDGIRRQIYRRNTWHARFATGTDAALAMLAESPADAVVADLRMPCRDGVELLRELKERYPDVVRIVMSGEINSELLFRAVPLAHRLIAKPCEPQDLLRIVEQTTELRHRLFNPNVSSVLSGMGALPPQPRLYLEVEEAFRKERSLQEVGDIVSRDPAISSKLLQLVNSAWFAARRRIDSVSQAVSFLGSVHTRNLVLSLGTACELARSNPWATHAIDEVTEHAGRVATLVQAFAVRIGLPRARQEECFSAAILHDIGRLLVITGFREIAEQLEKKTDRHERIAAERELLGTTHAELGARLLELWGVPDTVVDTTCRHEDAGAGADLSDTALLVRVANSIVEKRAEDPLTRAELESTRETLTNRKWVEPLGEWLPAEWKAAKCPT